MQSKQMKKSPISLHDQPCTYMTLLIMSSGDFMLVEDCLVMHLTQTLGLNTALQLGVINSAPRFWLGLLDSEADYWIVGGRPSPKLFAKYSNVKHKELNYFCLWKVLSPWAKLWDSCSLSPHVLAPLPKTSGVLLGFIEASDSGTGERLSGWFAGRH